MRDADIRHILHQTELWPFINDANSRVVRELKLSVARARIDLAVLNGSFHGYEIKSARDTLQRLPAQIEAYTKVFDYLTIVTEEKYCDKIIEIAPDWVGVLVCSNIKGQEVNTVRKGNLNPYRDGFHLADLLWKEELISILTELRIPFKKKHRNWLLCETLAANIKVTELANIVRERLKMRTNWKIELEQAVQ